MLQFTVCENNCTVIFLIVTAVNQGSQCHFINVVVLCCVSLCCMRLLLSIGKWLQLPPKVFLGTLCVATNLTHCDLVKVDQLDRS